MEINEILLNELVKIKVVNSNEENRVKDVLIAIHGFGGSSNSSTINFLKDNLVNEELALVTFDFPNHGDNKSDTPLVLKECIDYIKIVDEYVKKQYKSSRISYFASSFGAYNLLNFLSNNEYDYHRIFLRAPAINMHKVIKDVILKDNFDDLKKNSLYLNGVKIDYNFYNDLNQNLLLESYENKQFLYVIQGKKDEVVDYKDNEYFFSNKCKDKYKIYYFEDSKHSFKNEDELERLIEIIKNTLV